MAQNSHNVGKILDFRKKSSAVSVSAFFVQSFFSADYFRRHIFVTLLGYTM